MQDPEQKTGFGADVYSLAERKTWYSSVADAYNRVRPRYPQQLIDRAVELARLPPGAALLELGCGPATATVEFAQRGFSLLCLEPSREACQLARQNCAQYANVEIINTSFEEWQLEAEKFHAVLAANSIHWIAPEVRYTKAAAALQDNGSLILLWNMALQPSYEVYQVLDQVYQTHAPSLPQSVRYEERQTQLESLKKQEQAVIDSGLFKDLVSEQVACEVTYSIEDYLALLSTYSPYIALELKQRNTLFAELKQVLDRNCGTNILLSYLSAFHIAQKIDR